MQGRVVGASAGADRRGVKRHSASPVAYDALQARADSCVQTACSAGAATGSNMELTAAEARLPANQGDALAAGQVGAAGTCTQDERQGITLLLADLR